MLFEDIIILVMSGVVFFTILRPGYRLLSSFHSTKLDNLKKAREELETAQADLEAARLRKKAEELYDTMYNEALEDGEEHKKEKL